MAGLYLKTFYNFDIEAKRGYSHHLCILALQQLLFCTLFQLVVESFLFVGAETVTHGQNSGMTASYLIPNTDVNKQISDESPVDGWTFSSNHSKSCFTKAVFVVIKLNIL